MKKLYLLTTLILCTIITTSCNITESNYADYINNARAESEIYWNNIPDTNSKYLEYRFYGENTTPSFGSFGTDAPDSDTTGVIVFGVKKSFGDETIVKIPKTIEGYNVTAINYNVSCFYEDDCDANNVTELYIPDTVEDYHITDISHLNKIRTPKYIKNTDNITFNSINSKEIILPDFDEYSTSTEISLVVSDDIQKIYFGNGTKKIDTNLSNKNKLVKVAIPSTVTEIGKYQEITEGRLKKTVFAEDNIFVGSDNATIVCEKGSYAQSYAEKYNIKYELI